MAEELMELIGVKVPPDMKRQLEQMAEDERRPMSNLTRMLIEEAIRARSKKSGKSAR